MATPTIVYFGAKPTSIIMQSSTNFNGTAQTGSPTLSAGFYTFPAQAGGGLYNLHEKTGTGEQIVVLSITYMGGGTLTVQRAFSILNPGTPPMSPVGTISSSGDLTLSPGQLVLPPGEELVFTSSGGTSPVVIVTAMLVSGLWTA